MHLVGFIIRIYHDARSPERQIRLDVSSSVYTILVKNWLKTRSTIIVEVLDKRNLIIFFVSITGTYDSRQKKKCVSLS